MSHFGKFRTLVYRRNGVSTQLTCGSIGIHRALEKRYLNVREQWQPLTAANSKPEIVSKRPHGTKSRAGQKHVAGKKSLTSGTNGTVGTHDETRNPNGQTIEVLQSMANHYSRIGEVWRTLAYRKAISILQQQKVKISTVDEAVQLPGIGKSLAEKIEEIVKTGRLQQLEESGNDPHEKVMETFLKIWGVGPVTANKWIDQGFRTLEDLRAGAKLTANQRIGIEHYDDLNTFIPRSEVTEIGEFVMKEAACLDPKVELLLTGSHRRGAESSGDIDFIITTRSTNLTTEYLVEFLEKLVQTLTSKGCIVATLAAPHKSRAGNDNGPGSKFFGCCVRPGDTKDQKAAPWRRIDFLVVPREELGAALIYFTGSDLFVRSMRLLASKQGMKLNQRGLYMKESPGDPIEGADEKMIFEILGVKWREPSERRGEVEEV